MNEKEREIEQYRNNFNRHPPSENPNDDGSEYGFMERDVEDVNFNGAVNNEPKKKAGINMQNEFERIKERGQVSQVRQFDKFTILSYQGADK